VRSELRAKKGPGRLVVADMDLRLTPESQSALLSKVEDGASAIRLLTTVVPLVCLAGGLVIVAFGTALSLRRDGREPRHRREIGEAPATVGGWGP
jgi:hypothetical protein